MNQCNKCGSSNIEYIGEYEFAISYNEAISLSKYRCLDCDCENVYND